MSEKGIQSQLYADGTKSIQEDLLITMPRQFGKTKYLQPALYYEMCYTYNKELVDRILEEQDCSIDDIGNYIIKIDNEYVYCDMRNLKPYIDSGFSVGQSIELFDEANKHQPSTDSQITNLKSQLKHCKNPLQKLNLERKMNRLIRERMKIMDYLSVGLILFFIVAFVFNIFAMVENDCKEWFRDMLEYSIGVLILVFTLFLSTTIIMGLMCLLSITPFEKKRKDR